MKRLISCFIMVLLLVSCTEKARTERAIAKEKVTVKFAYFHKDFFKATPATINEVMLKHPYMFPKGIPKSFVIERLQDSLQRVLYQKVEKVYGDFTPYEDEITSLFKHIKYHFKGFHPPMVVTDITNMSYEDRVLYSNDKLLISLDMYLGKEPLYGAFSKYLAATFTPNHLTADVAKTIVNTQFKYDNDRTFLGRMIFEGKKLYLLDVFMPETTDEVKLGYTSKKLQWANDNEFDIWAYFMEQDLLYSTDAGLNKRFLEIAPFSKFYLAIDNDSPGYIGKYIGLKIVRAFMEENKVSPEKLMSLDAETIFKLSKYKPSK